MSVANARLFVDLRSAIGRGIFVTGSFDSAVSEVILAGLPVNGTFVDVGANVGFYTVLAADRVGPKGRVVALEPDPRPLRCLKKTLSANRLPQVRLCEVAVAEQDGHAGLSQEADCGHSHLVPSGGDVQVEVRALDSLDVIRELAGLDVLKIDVEGWEFGVLCGARHVLDAHRPRVVCEAAGVDPTSGLPNADRIVEFLRSFGYQVRDLPRAHTKTVVADHPLGPNRSR